MSYENAPATRLLATHCAACRRPLVDATSVNCGMGPDCREKHGYYQDVGEEERQLANQLVYKVALGVEVSEMPAICEKIHNLGFAKLAHVLLDRTAKVKINPIPNEPALLSIDTPYHPDYVTALKAIHPRPRWHKESKTWIVSGATLANKQAVLNVLKTFFKGSLALGPKGAFVI